MARLIDVMRSYESGAKIRRKGWVINVLGHDKLYISKTDPAHRANIMISDFDKDDWEIVEEEKHKVFMWYRVYLSEDESVEVTICEYANNPSCIFGLSYPDDHKKWLSKWKKVK